ncbi:hypothetical protein [Streptomyces bottropensis]
MRKIQGLDIYTFDDAHDFLKDYEVMAYVNCMMRDVFAVKDKGGT